MIGSYLFLVVIACIIVAMAIESLLRNISLLNLLTSYLLLILAILVGSIGLKEYFFLLNQHKLSLFLNKINDAFIIIASSSLYIFTIYFPRNSEIYYKNLQKKIIVILTIFSYFIGFLFIISEIHILHKNFLISFYNGIQRIYGIQIIYNNLYYFFLVISISVILISILIQIIKYKNLKLIYQKKQVRYFIAGLISFFILYLISLLFYKIKLFLFYYITLGISFLTLSGSIFYSSIYYQYTDLRKKFIFFLQEILIGFIVATPIVVILYIFRSYLVIIHPFFYFIIMIPLMVFFFGLYSLLKILIKRMLSIDEILKDITETFFDIIGNSHNFSEIAKNSSSLILENIKVCNVDFLIYNKNQKNYEIIYSATNKNYIIPEDNEFIKKLTIDIEYYEREILNLDPRFITIKDISEQYFQKYETSLVIPIFYENKIIALINIGRKIDNTVFSVKELALLSKLKKVCQIVINNLILFDKEEQAKLTNRDLMLASMIQESVFQHDIPEFNTIDIYSFQKPAKYVSGDYFYLTRTKDNGLGLLISDVSGKGFSAALVAMIIHTITKTQEFNKRNVNIILNKINELLTSGQDNQKYKSIKSFATIFCGYFDINNKLLYYTNAGHLPIIIYNKNKDKFDMINPNSKPAGIFEDINYPIDKYKFYTGNIFVFYSDGITEAINNQEQEFGIERLMNIIKSNYYLSSKELCDIIINEVSNFTQNNEQFDDITLIIVKIL